jgi:arsenate reductase (thioredoxin)
MNILFLCTGNSARSILAEALATQLSNGRLIGYSAGSKPGGRVNPFAEKIVLAMGYAQEKLSSKSWQVYAKDDAPAMHMIVTVCDNAAGEICPIWPGHPVTAHWGHPDPAAVEGSDAEKMAAFESVKEALSKQILALLTKPIETYSPEQLKQLLRSL